MGQFNLRWPRSFKRAIILGAITLLTATAAACSSGASVPESDRGLDSNLPGKIQSSGENTSSNGIQGTGEAPLTDELQVAGETQVPGEVGVPRFDVDAFARINPDPELRVLEPQANRLGGFAFSDEERIPRDAINPVYSPKFVSADDSTLLPEELVMGLEINGDARAYPVGMMRIREMVNDRVGGTPVLVTW